LCINPERWRKADSDRAVGGRNCEKEGTAAVFTLFDPEGDQESRRSRVALDERAILGPKR
jgi:hypothetical protein